MLFLLSLCLVLFLLCAMLKKPVEQMLAPFVCGLILVGYVLALFQALDQLPFMAYGAAGALLVRFLKQRAGGQGRELLRSLRQYVLPPGLLCFVILWAVFLWGSQPHIVTATDDIHYWAMEARSLFIHDGLVDAAHHLSPRFMTYTPGMQVFQWLGLFVHGEWSESVLYFMLWLFYAVFLLPFARGISWKKAYWIPVFVLFCIGFPTLMNRDAYTMLRVDTALGLCLGYALMEAWKCRTPGPENRFHLCCFALALCVVVLLKQIGGAWALLAVGMLLFVARPGKAWAKAGGKREKREDGELLKIEGAKPSKSQGDEKLVTEKGMNPPKPPLRVWAACLAPLLVFGSWSLFCAVKGLNGAHLNQATGQVGQMLQGAWAPPEELKQMPWVLWNVFTRPLASFGLPTTRWVDVPKLYWMVFLVAAPLGIGWVLKEERKPLGRLSLWLLAAFGLFFLGFAFSFMTLFATESSGLLDWGFICYLTERYFCPCLIAGMMAVLCALFSEVFPSQGLRPISWGAGEGGERQGQSEGPQGSVCEAAQNMKEGPKAPKEFLCEAAQNMKEGPKAPKEFLCEAVQNMKEGPKALAAGLLALALLLCDWVGAYEQLSHKAQAVNAQEEPFAMILAENFWVDELERPEDAVVLYGIDPYPFKPEFLQYALAPAKLSFLAEKKLSDKAFESLLKKRQITHLVCMDESNAVYPHIERLSEDGWADVLTLYTVGFQEDGTPLLTSW